MKILICLSRVPYPLEKGDKLRAYHQIRVLSQKHDIYLVALTDKPVPKETLDQLAPFCKGMKFFKITLLSKICSLISFFFRGLPFQCGYFFNPKIKKEIHYYIDAVQPDHIYCQLVRMAEYVKRVPLPKTLDYQDVMSKGMRRRCDKAPLLLKPIFFSEYKRLLKYERAVFDQFDHKTIITAVDRDLIQHPQSADIQVVANGVDFSTYQYADLPKKFDLIFSGNMSYFPNVDAAEFLVKQILPPLRTQFPNITVVLCGATPSPRVKALASPNVIVTGWVDSMAEMYAQSRIFVAPLQVGTGLQNKLLEAMAMKLPCVTSPLAGKPLENVQEGREVLICNTVSGYVDAISLLLKNSDRYAEIAENGHLFVKKNYNWEAMTARLEELL